MINRNLKSERARAGMTQEQLASKLGVTNKTISLYENGVRVMPGNLISAAADIFGCSTDYLLGRTKDRLPRSESEVTS